MKLYHTCDKCTFKTKLLFKVRRHATLHTKGTEKFNCSSGLEPYKCHKCKTFEAPLLSQLRHHIVQGHSSQRVKSAIYKCPKCDFQSFSKYLVSRHLIFTKHRKRDIYKCINCNYTTRFFVCLKRHVIIKHTDDSEINWLECEHCPFKAKFNYDLKRHVIIQHGTKSSKFQPLICDHCGYKCAYKAQLKIHKVAKHALLCDFKYFQCKQCHFKAAFQHIVDNHVTVMHGSNWFKCDQCDFETKYKQNLQNHVIRKHTESPNIYECEQCEYKTKIKGNLINHRRFQHVNNPVFHCATCDYKTNDNRSFIRHCGAFHDLGTYKCNECNLIYETKFELVTHKKEKHLKNAKLFQCQICDFKSNYRSSVRKHNYDKHTDKWVYCAHCAHKTKRKDNLILHLRRRHKLGLA